jgi:serine protease
VGIALLFVTTAAEDATKRSRTLVSGLTASAIDRGLRDNESPFAVRSSTDRVAAGDTVPYLPGSIVVKFRAGTTRTAERAMLALIKGAPTADLPYADFDIVTIESGADPEVVARRLSAQPDVEYAQARYRVRPLFVPNDPLYSRQWNFPAIDMERAWDINQGATSDITVAVLDTGMAFRSGVLQLFAHEWVRGDGVSFPSLGVVDLPFAAAPDLEGPSRIVSPHDFIWEDELPFDFDGHGTHVAGTIGQLTNNAVGTAGMAFNVNLMPIKVIDGEWDLVFGSPRIGTDDVVARAVSYAIDNGALVINMSIGRTGPPAPVVQSAIATAVGRGAFVVVAAGNEFLQGNPTQRLAEFAPVIDGMVAVGAIGRARERAAYSSTGSYIELAAPGGDIARGGETGGILQQTLDLDLSATFTGTLSQYQAPRFDSFAYYYFQGTSMASAHVAGFAALLMRQGVTHPAALEAVMKRFATDLGPTGRDNEYGYGLINPRAALRGLGLAR